MRKNYSYEKYKREMDKKKKKAAKLEKRLNKGSDNSEVEKTDGDETEE
jgi:hypothetical protein